LCEWKNKDASFDMSKCGNFLHVKVYMSFVLYFLPLYKRYWWRTRP